MSLVDFNITRIFMLTYFITRIYLICKKLKYTVFLNNRN